MHDFYIYIAISILFPVWLYFLSFSLKRNLHILQLEDYEPLRMLRFFIHHLKQLQLLGADIWACFLTLSFFIIEYIICKVLPNDFTDKYVLPFLLFGIMLFWMFGFKERITTVQHYLNSAKKRLVMTNRARRIFWLSMILSVILLIVLYYWNLQRFNRTAMFAWFFDNEYDQKKILFTPFYFPSFLIAVMPILILTLVERSGALLVSISAYLLKPIESLIQNRYLTDARRILDEIDPLVIGITGSYGKTGTKELLAAMLTEKYNIFKPPGSYNTLMGVTRIIREKLRPYHEIFIAEMGAYRIGSIDKLCSLTRPKYGIITIIGLQHLERFKTQAAIQKAKGELVRSLPPDGIAVLNGDDPLCREIGEEFGGKVVYFSVNSSKRVKVEFGVHPERSGCTPNSIFQGKPKPIPTVTAKNIQITLKGSDFTLSFPDDSELPVHLPLLGRPAIANATAAAAMADLLGVPHRSIKRALAAMPQVRHRLESRPSEGGITVIDDAFNSNPIGAAAALEVLAQATDGRRILVTPGMVELGELEIEANYIFGEKAASTCDLAVLVGVKRIEPIKKGLIDGGFDIDNIWVVPTLNEGLEKLKKYLKPGDTMLLENDLPDLYDAL